MIRAPATHPLLYQVNTRAWLYERGRALDRPATLDDVTDAWLDTVARDGFDWVWLLGVWQTGEAGRQISLTQTEWQAEYHEVLPDFTAADVCGSPFAIREYVVHRDFGGPGALARFRARLAARGIRLMLDFVPDHTAPIIRGCARIPSSTSREVPTTWLASPTTTCGSRRMAAPACWLTGATRTSPAGPMPCRSTTVTRVFERRCSGRWRTSWGSATGCDATWRCWSCPT